MTDLHLIAAERQARREAGELEGEYAHGGERMFDSPEEREAWIAQRTQEIARERYATTLDGDRVPSTPRRLRDDHEEPA